MVYIAKKGFKRTVEPCVLCKEKDTKIKSLEGALREIQDLSFNTNLDARNHAYEYAIDKINQVCQKSLPPASDMTEAVLKAKKEAGHNEGRFMSAIPNDKEEVCTCGNRVAEWHFDIEERICTICKKKIKEV